MENFKLVTEKDVTTITIGELIKKLLTFDQNQPIHYLNKSMEDKIEEHTKKEYVEAINLAYKALTIGMEDVPAGDRYKKCAEMRIEAKRALRKLL